MFHLLWLRKKMRTLKIPPFLLRSRDFRFKNVLLSNDFDDPDYFMEEEREAKSLSLKLFKRSLCREDYAVICGCDSTDSEITVGIVDQKKLYLVFQDKILQCVGECLIYQNANSCLSLFNDHVRFLNQEQVKLRKYQWFSRQKKACENFGMLRPQGLSFLRVIAVIPSWGSMPSWRKRFAVFVRINGTCIRCTICWSNRKCGICGSPRERTSIWDSNSDRAVVRNEFLKIIASNGRYCVL